MATATVCQGAWDRDDGLAAEEYACLVGSGKRMMGTLAARLGWQVALCWSESGGYSLKPAFERRRAGRLLQVMGVADPERVLSADGVLLLFDDEATAIRYCTSRGLVPG